ncbi:formate/nitrite transporter family protein [Kineococcus sp. SYSU DK005]|uniref:formate/nitrite transporter family protein n=1 Tax=Kineococcus sp. SYSU DK005 TaxID=3383126 RepID=UPI003D7CD97A
MAYKTPDQIAAAAVVAGEKKAHLPVGKMLVGGFLAGAYIAFAGLLAVDVTAGLDPAIWGGVTTLLTGAVFSMGLVLVLVAGAELLTGNMALVPMALLKQRATLGRLGLNWGVVLVANLIGSLFVAYVFAAHTGIIGGPGSPEGSAAAASFERLSGIATGKALTESNGSIFLRAIGCNWLVCLGVWMSIAAEDIAGKILAIFFPITAFVALGFDHVVANMFFLPAAYWVGTPGIGWGDILGNWLFAGLGNVVGGTLFVGVAYWYLYLRGAPPAQAAPAAGSDASGTTGAPRAAGEAHRPR